MKFVRWLSEAVVIWIARRSRGARRPIVQIVWHAEVNFKHVLTAQYQRLSTNGSVPTAQYQRLIAQCSKLMAEPVIAESGNKFCTSLRGFRQRQLIEWSACPDCSQPMETGSVSEGANGQAPPNLDCPFSDHAEVSSFFATVYATFSACLTTGDDCLEFFRPRLEVITTADDWPTENTPIRG